MDNWKDFIKYGVSEVLLVVIGILIALQINNWNESRKQRLHEIELVNLLITDLNDREIYKTKGNLNEYYDKSLNDQLLEGFKILVDHYNIGDSVVAVMPSKMAFGKRGSLVNMIAPYTPLKVSLKIIQK